LPDRSHIKRDMTANLSSTRPDIGFLGVGPEKTGTTWVHKVLAMHPELWLPPRKELRFFWEDYFYPNEGPFARFTKGNWHHVLHREYARKRLSEALRNPVEALRTKHRIAWDMRNLLPTHTDDWYFAQFRNHPSQRPGEISPQYFFLPRAQVEKVHRLCPNARIIVTLREPSKWAWSYVRMLVKKGQLSLDGPDVDAWLDNRIAISRFTQAAKNWLEIFPEGRVKIFFYEDLIADSVAFYKDLCAFMDIDPRDDVFGELDSRANVGRPMEQPERLKKRMEEAWREDVRELEALLGRVPDLWREKAALT